jgi:hypothetical protein
MRKLRILSVGPAYLAFAALLPAPAWPQTASHAAPFYALPTAGTWVEYGWTAIEQENQLRTGSLRISCVGDTKVRGTPCCWVEIRRESGDAGWLKRWVRKALVSRKALAEGDPLPGHVLECYEREGGPESLVRRLTRSRLEAFLRLGFESADAALTVSGAKQAVETGLGKFVARHVWAGGKVRGRGLEYHAWLTDRVPFGWARFEIRERSARRPARLVFTVTAQRSGMGAASELDESAAR